jgi:protein-disulfide isomerase-like protein with CxxC motif
MPFGEEEDTALIGLVGKIGNRWSRINEILGQQFPSRTRIEIKNHAKWLFDTRRNTQSVSRRQDESPNPMIEEEIPVEAIRARTSIQ